MASPQWQPPCQGWGIENHTAVPSRNTAENTGRKSKGGEQVHIIMRGQSVGNWGAIPRGKRAGNTGIWGESHMVLQSLPSPSAPPA